MLDRVLCERPGTQEVSPREFHLRPCGEMTCDQCGIAPDGTWRGWERNVGRCSALFSDAEDATYYQWVKDPHPDPAKAREGKKVYSFKRFTNRPRVELAEKYKASSPHLKVPFCQLMMSLMMPLLPVALVIAA